MSRARIVSIRDSEEYEHYNTLIGKYGGFIYDATRSDDEWCGGLFKFDSDFSVLSISLPSWNFYKEIKVSYIEE